MRIAMISSGYLFDKKVTGGKKRFIELLKAFISEGYDVDCYSPDSLFNIGESSGKFDHIKLKEVKKSKNAFFPTSLKGYIKNMSCYREIKKCKYDKVIVFDVFEAIWTSITNIANVQLFLRQDLIEYRTIMKDERIRRHQLKKIYIGLLKICEGFCCKKVDKILVQCKYDAEALIRRHPKISVEIKNKIMIQINNVNPSWIVNKSLECGRSRKEDGKFRLCFTGNFDDERKGQSLFLQSVLKLSKNHENIEAVIVGNGAKLEYYKKMCQTCPNIVFKGFMYNPVEEVINADLVVVPSLADSCPNTVMEALYNNIPVIGAKSGGIPEILTDEKALFDLNKEALSNKIVCCMNQVFLDDLRTIEKARREALTFDWGKKIIRCLNS